MSSTFLSLIPPGTGGVTDFAAVIGQPLGGPVLELTRSTDISVLGGDCLLLHFSGYGFQKRGVPFWLVKKVRALRKRFNRFGIVFHELFATGPVWGSAFWLSGVQQRIARDLLLEADFWLTNRDESARWLLERSQAAQHRVLPVFSTVGEPADIEGPRVPRMVIFGSAQVRRKVYDWKDGEIFAHAARLGLEIHDIGAGKHDEAVTKRMLAAGVVIRGKLSADAVSAALSEAEYGVVVYPADYVSKSSVFASYCAHGACPVLLSDEYGVHDGLRPNVHYASGFEALGDSFIDSRTVGRAARKWYEPHSVQAHVEALRSMTTKVPA